MNNESMLAAFAVVLILIFALAAFLDLRGEEAEQHRAFRSNPKCSPELHESEGKECASDLQAWYADLSAPVDGPIEHPMLLHGEPQQNLEGS